MNRVLRRDELRRALSVMGDGYLRRVVDADIADEPEAYDAGLLLRHADGERVCRVLRSLGVPEAEILELLEDPAELRVVLAEDSLEGVDIAGVRDEVIESGDALEIPGVRARVALTISALTGSTKSRNCVGCGKRGDGPVCSDCLGLG